VIDKSQIRQITGAAQGRFTHPVHEDGVDDGIIGGLKS
jgi:hypothetical protein